jgi:hypothetical protein
MLADTTTVSVELSARQQFVDLDATCTNIFWDCSLSVELRGDEATNAILRQWLNTHPHPRIDPLEERDFWITDGFPVVPETGRIDLKTYELSLRFTRKIPHGQPLASDRTFHESIRVGWDPRGAFPASELGVADDVVWHLSGTVKVVN